MVMLFVLKSFTKSKENLKSEQIYLEIFLYSAIFLKYWLTTLANLITLKAHGSSKAFNNPVVVMIKRILWIRASCLQ